MATNTIHELFAYLCVGSAAEAIQFYSRAFAGRERFRLTEPGGRVGHAEVEFGEGIVLMLCDPFPECGIEPPAPGASASTTIHLHVDNCDSLIAQALDAGATLERAPEDAFYGERSGVVRDPFGHRWNIGHSIEQVTPEEMQRRYAALLAAGEAK
jgi:PhnB protein